MKEFKAGKNEAGQRLDKYLKKILPNASMGFIYKMLRKKNIKLNDKKASGTEIVSVDDKIKIFLSDDTFAKFSVNEDSLMKDFKALGAQKNLAPAGVTFVIVKNDALGKVSRYIPTMLNYQTHVDSGSMFNTPPVVPIYAALQTLRWIKAQGGVKEMERRAIEKADMLYAEIDRNKMFVGTAAKEDRSRMNICFVMAPEYKDFEADFLKFATERGMVGIKGHRSVGGFRASCYNALPKESVQALIDCMQEFEKLH